MQQYVIFNVLKEYCIPKEEEEGQMKYNLAGIMYGRSRKQIPNCVPIILKHGCHGNTCLKIVIGRGKVIR